MDDWARTKAGPSVYHGPAFTVCSYCLRQYRKSLFASIRLPFSAELLVTLRLPHQQRVFVRLTERHAVERMLVRPQGVNGGAAVVDNAIQQAQFRGGATHLTDADVNADIRQAAVPPAAAQPGLQLLGTGLCVASKREERRKKYR